jgi:chromosome segregation ATPase
VIHAVIGMLERPPRAGNFITIAVALISRAARTLARRDSSTRINWKSAVLAKIQEQILTSNNIRTYIERVMESALKSQDKPSPEQDVVRLALNDLQSRLQRWEDALERGDLSIEHAAQRIRELHEQRQELLKKKQALDHERRGASKISPIPNSQIDSYITEMQRRLAAKQIGAKREFLQEVVKEVRVRGRDVTVSYKLPLITSDRRGSQPQKGEGSLHR